MIKTHGRSDSEGVALKQIMRMLPDDAAAEASFLKQCRPDSVACTHSGSLNVGIGCKHTAMPFRCREKVYAKRFSTKTSTVIEGSMRSTRAARATA